ncbi:IS3 family transposase [Paenibacillus sp. IHBB 10380]
MVEFIQFYNERRIHSSIQDIAPYDFYKQNLIEPIPIKAFDYKF